MYLFFGTFAHVLFFGTLEPSGSVVVSGRPICPILLFSLIQIQAGPTRGKTVEIRGNPWNFYVF